MSIAENFLDQTFLVSDADARTRNPEDLLQFMQVNGEFVRIPQGTVVAVTEARIVPMGVRSRVFAFATSANDGTEYGWTVTTNFEGSFRNVTLGLIAPEPGAGRYADTAAWRQGDYIGQVSLVLIIDNRLEIEKLTEEMAAPYFEMVQAAKADGASLYVNSGFRTYAEQKHLHDGWVRRLPGYNLAAAPGRSNHQNGTALDIPVSAGSGLPVYDWLAENATGFGFIRTVSSEPWHWEYRPADANAARQRGSHTLWK